MYKNYTCIYHYMDSGCKVGCYADNNHSITTALLNIDALLNIESLTTFTLSQLGQSYFQFTCYQDNCSFNNTPYSPESIARLFKYSSDYKL